jgi:hypothetical protein
MKSQKDSVDYLQAHPWRLNEKPFSHGIVIVTEILVQSMRVKHLTLSSVLYGHFGPFDLRRFCTGLELNKSLKSVKTVIENPDVFHLSKSFTPILSLSSRKFMYCIVALIHPNIYDSVKKMFAQCHQCMPVHNMDQS